MKRISYETLKGIVAGESQVNAMELFLEIREHEKADTPYPWSVHTRDGRYYHITSDTTFHGPSPYPIFI